MLKTKGQKLILPNEENISFSGKSADRLIASGDGDAALLFLYVLRHIDNYSEAEAARELRKPANVIAAAMARLVKMGLVKGQYESEAAQTAPTRVLPEDKLPEYTTADILTILNGDKVFSGLVDSVKDVMGKELSSEDIRKLLGIYRELGLPPEVILMLVQHCIDSMERKYGYRKLPTMRYIEKAAFTWEHEGLLTIEDANRYIKHLEMLRNARVQIRRVLQIRDRDFTPSEKKYVDRWIEAGFDPEAVAIAYDKTMVKTGRLAWAYLNSILASWHEKGIHTAKAVDELETKPRMAVQSGNSGGAGEEELLRMQRLLENMKNN